MENNKWNEARSLMERMDKVEGKNLNFIEHGNNKLPLVPLTESDIRRLLDRHETDGYIIISACRNINDFPSGTTQQELAEINNKRTKDLQQDIKAAGFSYKPVFGVYKEDGADGFTYEKSFFVFPKDHNRQPMDFNMLNQFAIEMIKKYGQDTYLRVTPNGESVAYINKEGEHTMEFSGDKTYNDYTQDFFTDLHKHSEKYADNDITYDKTNQETGEQERKMNPVKPTRFTLTEVYVNPRPTSYQEGHMRWYEGEYPDWSFKGK